MLSHIVLFWTDPAQPDAARKLLAGAKEYLPRIPGVISCHVGLMVPSDRAVVDGTYQVGLNITVRDKAAEVAYQEHPIHKEFFKACSSLWTRVKVYDFDDTV
jgi:hypothetical protein